MPGSVALVGGGRWARVWFRVLATLDPPPEVHWVSRRNVSGLASWLATCGAGEASRPSIGAQVHLYDDLHAVFRVARPGVAIVANLPHEHAAAVETLLARGCHVLAEKPLAPTVREAAALVARARAENRVLAVGLELMLATYVHQFARFAACQGGEVVAAEVVWHDLFSEVRSSLPKLPDLTTGVIHDLLPHVVSLLTVVRGPADTRVDAVVPADNGYGARIDLTYGTLPVTVSLSRVARAPVRSLRLLTASGEACSLDFTTEPGTLTTTGGESIEDVRWAAHPRPLDALLRLFLHEVEQREGAAPVLAERAMHVVTATDAAAQMMLETQFARLRPYLLDETDAALPLEARLAVREWLAPALVAEDVVPNPRDETELDRWSTLGWRVIHQFARHPFTTQRDMAALLQVEAPALSRLNRALRRSEVAQALIVGQGVAAKYWENTILPLLEAGVIDAARQGHARHPFRVGVYPGVSCMFSCSFCGRNREAKYSGTTVPPGNAMFDALFRDAPPDPYTFYVSGGLEPLTNPGIGALVAAGASRGFKLSMYTNGFMLTPQLLARQEGLWDLDTLRISMYGVNEAAARQVTGHPKAFQQVVQNATAFLKARNERGSSLKFGFNFVVLPGHVEEVLELLELIATMNRTAGGRQVDFLTLREDYSVPPERGLVGRERDRLAEIFEQVRERLTHADVCDLQIDLGYALHPLSQGGIATPLEMVAHTAMRPTGYPQVSVVVDLLGDVYLYREAGFLDRPGASRYIIGRVTPTHPIQDVIAEFLASGRTIEPRPGDTGYFDIFDHVVTHLLNQADDDEAFGVPFSEGPVRDRRPAASPHGSPVAHPTLAHPTLGPSNLGQPVFAGALAVTAVR